MESIVIIGAGPAGLMAAEVLSAAGQAVTVVDAMPSCGRKFLLAGRGGLNLTHAEPFDAFLQRFRPAHSQLLDALSSFDADAVRSWAHGLGIDTFVGSSQRVFPTDMKAAPLLRAWLQRLRAQGVQFHMRQRWLGWDGANLLFAGKRANQSETQNEGQSEAQSENQGENQGSAQHPVLAPRAVLLALGGGSWARLGSDGAWVPLLQARGVAISPLRSANCGFERTWSEYFRQRFAGSPLLSVALLWPGPDGALLRRVGQMVITEHGVEGSLIYAASADLRSQIEQTGFSEPQLDLLPDWSPERVAREVMKPRGSRSWASHLQSRLGLKGVQTALLRELLPAAEFEQPQLLAQAIKGLPLRLFGTRPIDEAISSAGGVRFEAMDENWMLRQVPGVFCCGEMLDWEAPTGGYLLTACLASGRAAAHGMLQYLAEPAQSTA
jgi:uncharacterized flavoprotein (TIGR03862 family)